AERLNDVMGPKSLSGKAGPLPHRDRQVVRKEHTEGVAAAYNAVRAKLDTEAPLGYSAAGIVVGVGEEVTDLRIGARVACAGYPYAAHAELLCVPQNLCVPLPANVNF